MKRKIDGKASEAPAAATITDQAAEGKLTEVTKGKVSMAYSVFVSETRSPPAPPGKIFYDSLILSGASVERSVPGGMKQIQGAGEGLAGAIHSLREHLESAIQSAPSSGGITWRLRIEVTTPSGEPLHKQFGGPSEPVEKVQGEVRAYEESVKAWDAGDAGGGGVGGGVGGASGGVGGSNAAKAGSPADAQGASKQGPAEAVSPESGQKKDDASPPGRFTREEYEEGIQQVLTYGFATVSTEGWLAWTADHPDSNENKLLSQLLVERIAELLKLFKDNPSKALEQEEEHLQRLMETVARLGSPEPCICLAYSPILILLFLGKEGKKRKRQAQALFDQLITTLDKMPQHEKHRLDGFWSFVATTKGDFITQAHVRVALSQICRAHPDNPGPAVIAFAESLRILPWNKQSREHLELAWGAISQNAKNQEAAVYALGREQLAQEKQKLSMMNIAHSRILKWWEGVLGKDGKGA